MSESIKLTSFSTGSGCGCKLGPADLEEILGNVAGRGYPSLLVGNDTRDDAAVLKIEGDQALISTTDFFTPIVDDAFDFGAISAANALSDVYAMGGKPLMALGVLGWPSGKLPNTIAAELLQGARSICDEAGIPLAGGHSIDNPQPFFGLSVNGIAKPSHIKQNSSAKPGDTLFLTKPLGIGMYATALKRGLLSEEQYREMTQVMKSLNSVGEKLGTLKGVNAMTDVTGFGLAGHLLEMTAGSGVSAEITLSALPLLTNAQAFMNQFIYPDNTTRNWKAYSERVSGINDLSFLLVSDPQTSGGLLVSVSEDGIDAYREIIASSGLKLGLQAVGRMIERKEKEIYFS